MKTLLHKQIVDCSGLQKSQTIEADVVVIGTGAGGGIAAQILAEAGKKVIMVEEGPYQTHEDFTMREADAYPNLYQEVASRKTVDKAITILQGRAVGGGTTVNWTSCFRFPDQTMAYWQTHYGWQLDNQTLKPWYEYAEDLLNIKLWPAYNPNNLVLQRGAEKLGWHHETIARNVRACRNLGYCGTGCPINAKQSTLNTAIPAALQQGARLYCRLRAERLQIKGDSISEVECLAMNERGSDTSGHQIHIRTKQVVLAAGGIGSPALLLRSECPDPYRLIGKRTFLHPTVATAAIMPEEIKPWEGAPQTVHSNEFLWRDGVNGEMGYKLETVPLLPAFTSTAFGQFGKTQGQEMADFAHVQPMIALLRDGFHADSPGGTVSLNRDGSPVLDYPMNDYYWRSIRHAYSSMLQLQFAAGASKARPVHNDANWYNNWQEALSGLAQLPMAKHHNKIFSAHVMGGCSMGKEARQSVVNLHGQHHQVGNLSIMDGSIFPSAAGVNPSLPIYAMAAWLASGLAGA